MTSEPSLSKIDTELAPPSEEDTDVTTEDADGNDANNANDEFKLTNDPTASPKTEAPTVATSSLGPTSIQISDAPTASEVDSAVPSIQPSASPSLTPITAAPVTDSPSVSPTTLEPTMVRVCHCLSSLMDTCI